MCFTSKSEIMQQLGKICITGSKYGLELSDHYCFELDQQQRLHLHILLTFRRTPMFTIFMKCGWHIHFQRINSWEKGIKYIHKHCESCTNDNHKAQWDLREWDSKARYHNLFIINSRA